MLQPSYLNANTGDMQVTRPSWWQGLFQLGSDAIRRALPLPGETAQGSPGVPSAGTIPAPPPAPTMFASSTIAGIPLWGIIGGLLVALLIWRKAR